MWPSEYTAYMNSLREVYERPIAIPNLKAGEGHGHYRGNREKPKKGYRQHKRAKRKLVKASRRRSRK